MARRGQLIEIGPPGSGMDAGADPQTSGQFKIVKNLYQPRRGALVKRTGLVRSTNFTSNSVGIAAGPRAPLIVASDSLALFDTNDDAHRAIESGAGAVSPVVTGVHDQLLSFDISEQSGISNGLVQAIDGETWMGVVYADMSIAAGATTRLRIIDKSTGATLHDRALGVGSTTPVPYAALARFERVGSGSTPTKCYFLLSGQLRYVTIDADGLVLPAVGSTPYTTGILTVYPNGANWLSSCAINDAGVFFAYQSSATQVSVAYMGSNGEAAATPAVAYTAPTAINGVTCWALDADEAGVAFWAESGTNHFPVFQLWDTSLTQTSSDVSPATFAKATYTQPVGPVGIARQGKTVGTYAKPSTVFYSIAVSATSVFTTYSALHHTPVATGITADVGAVHYNAVSAGEPFVLPMQAATDFVVPIGTLDLTDLATRSVFLFNQGGAVCGAPWRQRYAGYFNHPLRAQNGAADTPALAAASYLDVYEGTGDDATVAAEVFTLDDRDMPAVCTMHGAMLVGGTLPIWIDGSAAIESGYLTEPGTPQQTATGSGSMVNGATYTVYAVYERVDDLGRRQQSAPCRTPLMHTVTNPLTDGAITVTITKPLGALDGADTRIVIYRTTGDGVVPYRDVSIDVVPTAATTTITNIGVGVTDADLLTGEPLYTSSGTVSNAPSEPFDACAVHQSRVFVVPTRNPRSLLYSRETPPTEKPAFNSQLSIDLSGQAPVVALASHRDQLVCFSTSPASIFAIEGEGAADNGAGATFRRPYLISNALGIYSRDSLVRTPLGLMFQATDGMIWLLDNGMQLKPVGDRMRYYMEQSGGYQTVNGASVIPDRGHVIFTKSGSGSALVYDFVRDWWGFYAPPEVVQGSCAVGDAWFVLGAVSQRVWTDDRASHADVGASTDHIPVQLRSGWLSPMSYFRVKELWVRGYYTAPVDMRIQVGYGHDAYFADDETFDGQVKGVVASDLDDQYGAGAVGNDGKAFTIQFTNLTRQKTSAFRYDISDAENTGKTAGIVVTSVQALIQPIERATKPVGDARRV